MKAPSPLLLSLYGTALHLYPSRLRREYKDQMLQVLCDAYTDNRSGPAIFWLCIFADLLQSSAKEHLLMIRQQILSRPIFFHALILGFILTLCGGAASATFQQMLRRGANQPQAQMADSYASEIASGIKPNEVIPRNYIDLERSLEPFVIFYNDQATPTTSTGYLNHTIPTPPPGVFKYLRTHKSDTVTWQSQPNVRIAAVIQRISGPTPGFLLAGRSLRLVEEQENLFWRMAFIGWLILVFLLIAGAALLNRIQQHAAVAPQ
jgi:hypothetical protein